ncbi:MAG: PAS domain-containing protein [Beijerinckiaceae bacterium]
MSLLYTELYENDLQAKIRNPEVSFALSTWEIQRSPGALPSEAIFLRSRLDWLMQDVMLLRHDADGDLVYQHYGQRIAAAAGFDMTGKKVSDFKGALGDFYRALYSRTIAERRAFVSVHRLGHFSERPMWERVILPLSTDGAVSALFVVNRVLDLGKELSLTLPRTRLSGVLSLQFVRDTAGTVTDIVIIGANKRALSMIGRRLDQITERSMREAFPGIDAFGLWEDYIKVATTREPAYRLLDYAADGMKGTYDVQITPFRDGVLIDFQELG